MREAGQVRRQCDFDRVLVAVVEIDAAANGQKRAGVQQRLTQLRIEVGVEDRPRAPRWPARADPPGAIPTCEAGMSGRRRPRGDLCRRRQPVASSARRALPQP